MSGEYLFFCPICGKTHLEEYGLNRKCRYCGNEVTLIQSQYPSISYFEKAIAEHKADSKYSVELTALKIAIDNEISKNPMFNKELCDKRISEVHYEEQKSMERMRSEPPKKTTPINVPKCPTCQSTNIEKISTTDKVVGAAFFGFFSKTAKSQFRCKNCGYKW